MLWVEWFWMKKLKEGEELSSLWCLISMYLDIIGETFFSPHAYLLWTAFALNPCSWLCPHQINKLSFLYYCSFLVVYTLFMFLDQYMTNLSLESLIASSLNILISKRLKVSQHHFYWYQILWDNILFLELFTISLKSIQLLYQLYTPPHIISILILDYNCIIGTKIYLY